MARDADVTALLLAWSNGEITARSRLIDAVYGELRRLARGYLRRERPDHSLPPTALVHEAYSEVDRSTACAVAESLAFLCDCGADDAPHSGRSCAGPRGGKARPWSDGALGRCRRRDAPPNVDVLALDAALDKLAEIDPRQSQLVELRFFGGMTVEETATVLGVAPITVKRDWALARAWLFRQLRPHPQ